MLDIRHQTSLMFEISFWWNVSSPGRLRFPACRRSRPCLLATNISGKWISFQARRFGCWWRLFWISSSSLHCFLSSARSCLKMKRMINLLFQLCSGWYDHWFVVHTLCRSVQSRHPPFLMTGRCHWSQVTTSQSEDRVVTWLTNQKPSLRRTYHYPRSGYCLVSHRAVMYCHVKWSRNWLRCQLKDCYDSLWFLVSSAQWMTSERGGRLSNCVVISVMKIDRTLIELANHHQQPGWAGVGTAETQEHIQHHTSLNVLLRLKIGLYFFRL